LNKKEKTNEKVGQCVCGFVKDISEEMLKLCDEKEERNREEFCSL
jgi:hypothetical protein